MMTFIFAADCSHKRYALPHDQFCFSVYPSAECIELTQEDKSYIINLPDDGS